MASVSIKSVEKNYAIAFEYDPHLVSAVKEVPNRRFDRASKLWTVPKTSGEHLTKFIDAVRRSGRECSLEAGIEAELAESARKAAESIAESKLSDTGFVVPCPDGLEFRPFQRAGVAYAVKKGNALIADEMGLGKTPQSVGVSNCDPSVQSVLVIVPSSLRINWQREWKKWCTKGLSVGVFQTGASRLPPTNVVVINYDNLKKMIREIHDRAWDMLVCDEAHALKNPKALRSLLVLGGQKKVGKGKGAEVVKYEAIFARRKLYLTGTPIMNKPIEIWPLVHSLCPDAFRSWKAFVYRYCGASFDGYGMDVSGATNLDELQEVLRTHVMVRRLKKDVLTELPAKQRQVVELEDDSCSRIVSREWSLVQQHEEKLEALRVAAELAKAGTDEEYEQAVAALTAGSALAFTEMAAARRDTALAKLPLVIDHLKEIEADKVILFAHHHDVVNGLKEAFPDAVVVTGQTKLEDRQAAVDRFQNDPSCRVFIGNIRAAGVGLTLTASSYVAFAELDWTPAMMTQAEDRAHRLGQKDSVLVQHLVLNGSLDAVMAKRLIGKQKIADAALDIEHADREPLLPMVTSDAVTQTITHKAVVEEAEKLSPDEIATIHAGLRKLAAMCDGAQAIDGAGFNKFDVRIGMSLAEAPRLTAKQAVLGKKLVHKYRRQLGV